MSARLTVHFSGLAAAALAAQLPAEATLAPLAPLANAGDAAACALFGLRGAALPLAAITYAADFGAPPPAWCARLDPVCLLPAGATLRLIALDPTPLAEPEARALFEQVSSAGVIPEVRWRYGAPLRWYVEAAAAPDIQTCPPDALPGGDVAAGQPRGADAPRWQGWLNELQMLLFDAAPNLAREARDLPPANGLWLWGGGLAPRLAAAPFAVVATDQPLIGGLARLAGRAPQPLPAAPADWLAALPPGQALLGLGAAQAAHWLDALPAALARGQLDEVTLLAGGARFSLRRRGLLARLRRRLPPWR